VSSSDLAVGGIVGDLHVPASQRGCRWGPIEVEQALDDIAAGTATALAAASAPGATGSSTGGSSRAEATP
jgi:hypothetical protein